ncbi:antibiotic biosynthesis monooxygenase [Streptomyces sp. NPDC006703]|uniref:antibiotic biosynthesis monooxygenase n=1 Tax=Streptomyces sp. NPDC006703 TaxID=3364759 RepID=UPI0036B29D13
MQTLYVRTIYATGDPAKLDGVLDALRSEAPGLLSQNPGYHRYGLFADREIGKILMGSWWESENDRAESDARLGERRAQLLAPFADTVTADDWEAVSYTPTLQVAPDMWLRTGQVELDPSDAPLYRQAFDEKGRPQLEALDGAVSATLFMNAAAGRANVGALFRDRDTLAASRGPQSAIRGAFLKRARATLRSLEEFELIMVHRPQV